MMAGKSTPVTAEGFEVVLEGRYEKPGQEDQHIDYFFIRVSHQIANRMPIKELEAPDGSDHNIEFVITTSPGNILNG